MYKETLDKICNSAMGKVRLINESQGKYFVASALAGLYVGLGIFLIMTIGGFTKPMGGIFKVLIGAGFGIALSLVIMAGSELFTGNNLVMTAGASNKVVGWQMALKIWIYSWLGNLAGSIIGGAMFVWSSPSKNVSEFIVNLSASKMSMDPSTLFFKGIMCNLLVCLAVLCCIKMNSESGKLIMIFWCLFAFITSGFSHSVANMTIFTSGLMLPHGASVSVAGAAYNLFWVTLGLWPRLYLLLFRQK